MKEEFKELLKEAIKNGEVINYDESAFTDPDLIEAANEYN